MENNRVEITSVNALDLCNKHFAVLHITSPGRDQRGQQDGMFARKKGQRGQESYHGPFLELQEAKRNVLAFKCLTFNLDFVNLINSIHSYNILYFI